MPGPPPPKPKTPDDLAEVERALSVLQGRHPEHERARREQEEARAKRQEELDSKAKAELKIVRARQAKIGAMAGVALVVAGALVFVFRRELARRSKLELSTDPYRAMGFTVVDTAPRGTPGKLEVEATKACYLAVSTDAAPLEITRAGGPTKGPGPALFCTCDTEKVTITSEVAEGGGLSILRIDTAVIGGSRAFPFAVVKAGTFVKSDEACAEASLDAWIAGKRYPAAQPDEKWLAAEPKRAALTAASAKVLTTLAADLPLSVVETTKESCLLVVSEEKTDKLGLRLKGGASPFTPAAGSFVWCSAAEGAYVVTREGKGKVTAVSVPADKIGGLRGAREVIGEAGIAVGFSGIAPGDLAWDAKEFMLASAVPETLVTTAQTPDVAQDTEARLVTLAFATPNALVPELQTDTFSYCEPALDENMRESLCLFSGSQTWKMNGAEATGGMARAKLPFWLFGLQGVNDPVALKAGVRLVDIARRLKHRGFEPTTIEAMTEQPTGVDVLGRTNEDAVVAIGVAPVEPWVFTYSDGPAWSLDDEPRVIPIKPLEKLTLKASVNKVPPKEKRRSVIFRRQSQPR